MQTVLFQTGGYILFIVPIYVFDEWYTNFSSHDFSVMKYQNENAFSPNAIAQKPPLDF